MNVIDDMEMAVARLSSPVFKNNKRAYQLSPVPNERVSVSKTQTAYDEKLTQVIFPCTSFCWTA